MGLDEEARTATTLSRWRGVKSIRDGKLREVREASTLRPQTRRFQSLLETVTGYDASYNPEIFGGCEGAQITAYRATDGATGEALEKLYTVAETGNGYYTVTFSQAGESII